MLSVFKKVWNFSIEEPSNENTLEEKAIEDEIKTSDDKKENSIHSENYI